MNFNHRLEINQSQNLIMTTQLKQSLSILNMSKDELDAEIIKESGATLVGAGIVIEKAYQRGGQALREKGIRVESLARIQSMNPETGVVFV